MPALSEYTNVYNSALVILQKKGYQLWYDDEIQVFCAEKDGWDFLSESPCGLLGLVAMFEFKQPDHFSEYWWRDREPELYDKLPKAPPRVYRSVSSRRR